MYKHLRFASLIVLFAFIALPLVSFAHYGDGSFHAIHCTTCGEAAHMNPNDCKDHDGPEPVYQHASDCPCNDCEAKRVSSAGETFAEDLSNLVPGTQQMRSGLNFLMEMFRRSKSVPYIEDPDHIPFN